MEVETLPTLHAVLAMKMDCKYWSCSAAARFLARECGHDLLVCHHKNEGGFWQVTVRHGKQGEAVMLLDTGDSPVSSRLDEIREWIRKVHDYEQVPAGQLHD